ncbi:Ger(x)C family spore germination protein [Paenibacillus hodogayensis]
MRISPRSGALAAMAALLLLTGCWDRIEINDMAIVMGAGIDQDDQNKVHLSVEVYLPTGSSADSAQSGSDSGSSKDQSGTITASASGGSLSEALGHLQERLSRRLYWGHNNIYIIGKKRAEHGIQEDLEFVLRFIGMRERASFYVSEGRANEVLQVVPYLERSAVEALRELSKTQVSTEVDMKHILERIVRNPEQTFYVPHVLSGPEMVDKGHIRNTDEPYFRGLAVLKNGKLVGTLDNDSMLGTLWLTDRVKSSTQIAYPAGRGKITMSLSSSSTERLPRILPDGTWEMRIKVRYEGDIVQNTASLDPMKPEELEQIVEGANTYIRSRIERALESLQKKQADVLDFGEQFHKKYPKAWKQEKANWGKRFAEVKPVLDVQIATVRQGVMTGDIPSLFRREEGGDE